MTKADIEDLLATLVGYRGKPLLEQERKLFAERFGGSPRELVERAIHQGVDETGYSTLAVIAHRVAQIHEGQGYGPNVNVASPRAAALEKARDDRLKSEAREARQAPQPPLTPLEEHDRRHDRWRKRKGNDL